MTAENALMQEHPTVEVEDVQAALDVADGDVSQADEILDDIVADQIDDMLDEDEDSDKSED